MGSAGSERVRVWCDGCFDLVHYGHANSLRQAKAMGDVLVVGVHSDADIRTCKGPPVFTQDERYAMVRAIKWVDEVVEGSTYWPDAQTLAHHNCAFATHGDDLSVTKDGKDPYQALKDLGKLKIYQRTLGVSTTDIVGRMLLLTKTHHASSHQPVDDNSPVHQVGVKAWAAGPGHPRISQFLPTAKKLAQFSDGKEPLPGDFVVYVSGDFDLLHPGHLAFLKAARAEGDYLIVGIHSDHIVNAKKGGNYPIMNLYERSLSLLACRYVDEVIIAAPYDVTPQLLDQMKVDLVCHGCTDVVQDPEGRDPYHVPKSLGKFKRLITGNTLTTNHIVQRIIANRLLYSARNEAKAKREEIAEASETS